MYQMFVTTEDGMKYTETWSSNNTCILPPKSRDLATWPPPPTRTPHTLWFISRAQDYTEEHVLHLKGELYRFPNSHFVLDLITTVTKYDCLGGKRVQGGL